MFTVSFPEDLASLPKRLQKRFERSHTQLLDTLGIQLMSNVSLDYIAKSRGRTGSDGEKWKKLTPETERRKGKRNRRGRSARRGRTSRTQRSDIGVDSGLQKSAGTPGFRGPDGHGGNVHKIEDNQITVGFGREYSEDFDEDRKLIPTPLPEAWIHELEQIVIDHHNTIIEEEMQ